MCATEKMDVATDAARLVQCLDEQAAIFKQWVESEAAKERALLSRDRPALEAVIAQQEGWMATLHALQNDFFERLGRLAAQLGSAPTTAQAHAAHGERAQPGARANLLWQQVAQRLPPRTAERLQAARRRVDDGARRVRERGQQNQQLLQQAAAHNAVILAAFAGPEQETVTYGAPVQAEGTATGRGVQSPGRRLVDWQA